MRGVEEGCGFVGGGRGRGALVDGMEGGHACGCSLLLLGGCWELMLRRRVLLMVWWGRERGFRWWPWRVRLGLGWRDAGGADPIGRDRGELG